MNRFATIKHIQDNDKVYYYSIQFKEESECSLFEQFMQQCEDDDDTTVYDDLTEILEWVDLIGDEYGAKPQFFRHEGAASALPPPQKMVTKVIEGEAGSLRLYCLVASESVVFLFSGGKKTQQKAQDCPQVASHFKLANRLATAINEAFLKREIRWNDFGDDIEFENDLELTI